jgi:hypothetical protein
MIYNQKKLFLITSFFVFCTSLTTLQGQADPSVSRAEYEALAARVSVLEARLNNQMDTLTSDVLQAMPEQGEGQKSLISSVVDAVKQREQQVNFPWMDSSKWALIREGQSVDQVTAILGKPTLNEPSLRKWVDYVYSYQGRRPSDNKRIEGKVRFKKDMVVDIDTPNL